MSATGYLLNTKENYSPQIPDEVYSVLNDFESSIEFHKELKEYNNTPFVSLPSLSAKTGVKNIFVKDESKRFGTGALKVLGASYAVNHYVSNEEIIGICTATDGNHGRAVAWAAKQKGIKAVVFVPSYTAQSRIKAIENEGAKVLVTAGNYDEAVQEAAFFAREKHFKLIQDTAWREYQDVPAYITAGYYTELIEISQQTQQLTNPKIDVVFVQAGVGSWPSAVVHFIRKYLNNKDIKIVCVEPYESDCIYESIKNESIASTRKSQETIMAGLNCGTPSVLAFEILKQGVDAFLLISDQHTIDAIKYLNAPIPGDPYISAGESGASGLGGFLAVMNNHALADLRLKLGINDQSNVLVFNTESVTDPDLTSSILDESNAD